jgi:hypothetical protein
MPRMQDLRRLPSRIFLGIVTAAVIAVSAATAWSEQVRNQPPKFEDTKRWVYDAKGGRQVTITAEQQKKQWERRQARKAKRKAAKAAEAAKEAAKAAEASKDAAK